MQSKGMRIFGQADHKGVSFFLVGNIHHYDMGMLLDRLVLPCVPVTIVPNR